MSGCGRASRTRMAHCVYDAWCDAIHCDGMRSEVVCERASQTCETRFRGNNVRATGSAGVRRQAADVHDDAAARGNQMRQRLARTQERTVQRDGQDLAPLLIVEPREVGFASHARVVHENVEPAEMIDGS